MKQAKVYRLFDLTLPDHVADWDGGSVLEYWERQRWHSIGQHIGPEDALYVVGAEHGFIAATYAKLTKATLLVEPCGSFWPNIRKTWEANDLSDPYAKVVALVGDEARGEATVYRRGEWPPEAEGEESPAQAYRYIHDPGHVDTPIVTLDWLVEQTGIPPRGISIDVEGAELLVLRGASETLSKHRPVVWVSIHPDLMLRDYDTRPLAVHKFLMDHDYVTELINVDHEEHWIARPTEGP